MSTATIIEIEHAKLQQLKEARGALDVFLDLLARTDDQSIIRDNSPPGITLLAQRGDRETIHLTVPWKNKEPLSWIVEVGDSRDAEIRVMNALANVMRIASDPHEPIDSAACARVASWFNQRFGNHPEARPREMHRPRA